MLFQIIRCVSIIASYYLIFDKKKNHPIYYNIYVGKHRAKRFTENPLKFIHR